ncbi:MAG: transpeptidase family protein [Deltaproteobacteria bacterium]|nr:transpeptidase family protein [Deltaproteobacteria bacterium]
MKVREKRWIRFRIYLVTAFFVGSLGIILARAYQLQVLRKEKLTSIALSGYRDIVKLPPKRGTIYDRKGRELALTVEVESIFVHPRHVQDKSQAAKDLAAALGTPMRKTLDVLKSERSFVWLERKATPDKVAAVKALGIDGVGFTTEARRYYPGKEIAGHVLGFAGEDNQGLEGLEKQFDSFLKGSVLDLVQMRDALGRPFSMSRPVQEDRQIRDIVLTIDKDIQYTTEQALGRAVQETSAKSGHSIVVDPETGEVLAMAVIPLYNPNVFWEHQPFHWRNRAVTDSYEPGSTIKAYLAAAALDSGLVSPDTKFFCEHGEYKVGGSRIRDHNRKGYGYLSVNEIITYSSNIGAVKIGERIGYKRFTEYLKRFGFGEKTGIELPGETAGFIRPHKEAKEIDKATTYFGQGMTVNSLQVAMATAAIANGGKLMRPYLLKEVREPGGRVIEKTEPHVVRKVLSAEAARLSTRILESAVGETGTGFPAAISGYRVAGKTGTAQKVDLGTKRYSDKNYVALFVGFAPADRPRMLMVVVLDEPEKKKYGGLAAAPVFREVGAWAMNRFQINPDLRLVEKGDPKEEQKSAVRVVVAQEGPGLLPDFKGRTMREVLKTGRSLNLEVLPEGTGLAFSQHPEPGLPLDKVNQVRVTFRPPT